MYHRRIALFSGALALSSFVALGAGDASGSAAVLWGAHGGGGAHVIGTKPLTIHTEVAVVGPTLETILVNANGLPLYYFRSDTPSKSKVNGALAHLWPPLITTRPTASGVKGRVLSLKQPGGSQVSYKGHFLYTFIDDSPGHVTGQGVSNFFVATPNIRVNGRTAAVSSPTTSSSHGYGY
jgi:predicted lipoprotein with Yx(FWY)xxD motif